MNQLEDAENPEVAPICGCDSFDPGAVIVRSKQGIKNAFAAQSMALHPIEKNRK
ncbi:MAG: hypothetical protein ACNA7J_12385 [Wenzhouxiangella sp.]